MLNRERLLELAASLPEDVAGELLDFVEVLRVQRRREQPSSADAVAVEGRTWLDADLSRFGAEELYAWGKSNPLEGRPIYWDAERNAFMAGERS